MTMFPQFHWGGWSSAHRLVQRATSTCSSTAATPRPSWTGRPPQGGSFYAIPAIWRRILEADPPAYDLTSLTRGQHRHLRHADRAPPRDRRGLPRDHHQLGYGATEAGGLCSLPPRTSFATGSVGLPIGRHADRIEDGELWVRSPQTFIGYFRNPEATAEVVVDGWYRTGDLVERDDEGYSGWSAGPRT